MTPNILELEGSNTQPRAQQLQKLSTTTQTTTGARRLQIDHDGSSHTSKCVDTQADCVDTTGYCFRTGFWDSELVSTHSYDFLNDPKSKSDIFGSQSKTKQNSVRLRPWT
ncbi:hypothetical protein Taro_021941 [Colocasia esculenta]|uniref:Uncharacterized protein n=1 Tax=Colocasia esculenta TaxID=4460 RepID=A0A843V0B5_COLES|nr:hypothetical protein [Colocasia esculenta]